MTWTGCIPNRERIESALAEREKTLFDLDDTLYLYDLTSTYFEGEAASNPQAKRGYSRDKRGDAKRVLVGLVLDRDGFPKAHEIFDGNRQDRTTVGGMLDHLEKRTGRALSRAYRYSYAILWRFSELSRSGTDNEFSPIPPHRAFKTSSPARRTAPTAAASRPNCDTTTSSPRVECTRPRCRRL